MTRWHETGLHSFLTRWHDTGLHSFLRQDGMRQDCIHFYDKMAWDRTASISMTTWHETGTHPFYIAMYIHIYTHIYVHIYTSQKECLCIFSHAFWNFNQQWWTFAATFCWYSILVYIVQAQTQWLKIDINRSLGWFGKASAAISPRMCPENQLSRNARPRIMVFLRWSLHVNKNGDKSQQETESHKTPRRFAANSRSNRSTFRFCPFCLPGKDVSLAACFFIESITAPRLPQQRRLPEISSPEGLSGIQTRMYDVPLM